MVLTSIPDKPSGRVIRGRFIRGTCHEGIDYGPDHLDIEVPLPEHKAREYAAQGRFRPSPEVEQKEPEAQLPPVREIVDAPPAPPAAPPAAETKPEPPTRRSRRRTKK